MHQEGILSKKPLVSVVMITYMHEAFITKAIEGVLMQKVDCDIELIIVDDCSPDNTSEIVNQLINNNPNGSWIRYIRHPKNIGMMPNFIFALKLAKGDFIALCEGDDFWIDSKKIQKQLDFLINNHDYNIVFHKAKILNPDGTYSKDSLLETNADTLELEDVIKDNFMHTPTVFFRNVNSTFPHWFYKAMPGDHPLQIMLLMNGKKAKNLIEEMSVYRVHAGGIWSDNSRKNHLFERAITQIELNKMLASHGKPIKTAPLYMLADYISQNGYIKINRFQYYSILLSHLSVLDLFKRQYFYLFHPKIVHFLKSKFQ